MINFLAAATAVIIVYGGAALVAHIVRRHVDKHGIYVKPDRWR